MADTPAAEVDVTVGLVEGLVRDQHPDLADLPLRVVANGWDNVTLRLGEGLAVRVPRREAAADLVRHEQQWLPVLGPPLGIGVPAPVRTGRPSDRYPWAWSIVPWFEGRAAIAVPVADRSAWATQLADVVARLHVPAPADAPRNPVRGVPLAERDTVVRSRIAVAPVPDRGAVAGLWEELCATPVWNGPALWLHGDLHPGNLVVDDDGLVAVIDFGDLTGGDPASDLATAWLTFDHVGRREFRARMTELRGTDGATWRRARGWALALATAFLAHSDDSPAMAGIGEHALREVLAED
jgi:aminoglycoside phosphotransferase (APT) family kinase protein